MLHLYFLNLLYFLWIGKQTFKNEFVIWKDSCDQVSLNRIQDVIFELHYPHQRGEKREGKINKEESESKEETDVKRKVKEEKVECHERRRI